MNQINELEPFQLMPHPANEQDFPGTIFCKIKKSESALDLSYSINGNLDQIRWQKPQRPQQGHELWQHTCLEAFIGIAGNSAYWEYNFSPSLQWDKLCFSNYRQTSSSHAEGPGEPRLRRQDLAHCFELTASIPLLQLSDQSLELGISAIIETIHGQKLYFALRHEEPKPDFHQRSCFTIQIL